MQLCVAVVSEEKNPVQLPLLRHTASLLHRARWLQLRRCSSHPIICLLTPPPPPPNAFNSGSKEIFFVCLFLLSGVEIRKEIVAEAPAQCLTSTQ